MQDFRKFDFTITTEELAKAAEKITNDIIIIINGEYYTLKKPENAEK